MSNSQTPAFWRHARQAWHLLQVFYGTTSPGQSTTVTRQICYRYLDRHVARSRVQKES